MLKKLSELQKTNKQAYELVEKLRAMVFIAKSPEDIEAIKTLLVQDKTGDAYKYFFDLEGSWADPLGNNLLLLTVSKGCNPSRDKGYVQKLTEILLADAKLKLTKQEFHKFVSFRYGNGEPEKYSDWAIGYDNTPLTLSIKSGILLLVRTLINEGADVTIGCGYGDFTPLHLAILRHSILPGPVSDGLIKELIKDKKSLNIQDKFGHTAKDLLNYGGLKAENCHIFTLNHPNLREKFKIPYKNILLKNWQLIKALESFFKKKVLLN